jgi:hypothetical protein
VHRVEELREDFARRRRRFSPREVVEFSVLSPLQTVAGFCGIFRHFPPFSVWQVQGFELNSSSDKKICKKTQ